MVFSSSVSSACSRRCLAVASGPYRAEELRGADAVATDARELAGLLASLAS